MLYIIYIIYIILGLLFLFFPKNIQTNKEKVKFSRMIKQDCSTKKVKCIDSCEFLCSEDNYECKNNLCLLKGSSNIKCNKETGGIIVLTHFNFIPYWECLCTKPHLYGGSDCSVKRFDVCNKGTFNFSLDASSCICKPTDFLIYLNNKPYCLDAQFRNFFTEGVII